MNDQTKLAPIDRLPPDVREIVDTTMKLLVSYMPGRETIEMLVGRNVKATIKFEGGPITREVIEDTLAHLAFYKKYFPKDAAETGKVDSPEKFLDAMVAAWEVHRELSRLETQKKLDQETPPASSLPEAPTPAEKRKTERHYQSDFQPT